MKLLAFLAIILPLAVSDPLSVSCEVCYCADASRVGWVSTHTLTDGRGVHSFRGEGSAVRLGKKKHLIGRRCENGTTDQGCINIPKITSYSALTRGPYPPSADKRCYTFDDGLEFCAGYDEVRIDGGKRLKFAKQSTERIVLMDCTHQCKNYWRGGNQAQFDICAYAVQSGELVPQSSKTWVDGAVTYGHYGCYVDTATEFKVSIV
jgi:hypothetical protein